MRPPALLVLLPLLLLAPRTEAKKTWLDAPAAPWEELAPYVHANVVPFLTAEGITYSICTGTTERSVASPFDEKLSAFTKVMLLQLMYRDDDFSAAMGALGQDFRERLPSLSPEDREQYRALFWKELDGNERIQSALRGVYERARAKGKMRCWICDEDSSCMATIKATVPAAE